MLVFRTGPNTLGFEKSTDGTQLWRTDCDTGVTDFNYNPTVSGNTIWHAGNDGSGTGLDADTVDGLQSSSFLRSDATDIYYGGTLTIQSNSSSGAYQGFGVRYHNSAWRHTNNASYGWAFRNNASSMSIKVSKEAGTTDGVATFNDYNFSGTSTASITVAGSTVWHAGNDGAASGLDADTLDGLQGSSYLQSTGDFTKTAGTIQLNDASKLHIGTGDDLEIKSNGFNSYFNARSGADIYFQEASVNRFTFDMGLGRLSCDEVVVQDGVWFGGTTSTANKLEDYEEGSWSATFNGISSSTILKYDQYYTKIGRQVTCQIRFFVQGNSDTSDFVMTGLPFNVQYNTMVPHFIGNETMADNNLHFVLSTTSSGTIYGYNHSDTAVRYTELDGSWIRMSFTYITAF